MAFDITGLQAYTEEQPNELLTNLQAEGGLADVVSIQVGIKGSQNIHLVDSAVTFQDDDCSPTFVDTTTLTNRKLTVGKIAVNEKVCLKTLDGFYVQTLLKKGSAGEEEMPLEIEKAWLESKGNKIKRLIAIADFQGDTTSVDANLNKYDGLLKILNNSIGVVVGNTSGAFVVDKTNILTLIEDMYLVRPESIRDKDNVSLWMSYALYDMYIAALKAANLYHFSANDGDVKYYGTNVTIRPTVGLTGVTDMVLAEDSNIVVGLDGDADEEELKVIFDKLTDNFLFRAKFKRGVQVAFPDRIVHFKI